MRSSLASENGRNSRRINVLRFLQTHCDSLILQTRTGSRLTSERSNGPMKRIIISIALLALAGIAIAQQPRRPGPPPPRELAQFLGLTSDQQTQIDALHQSMRTTIEPLFEQRRAEDEKLHSMIESPAPDATAIGKQVLAVHAIDEQIKSAHDAMDQKIETLLNADQKLKFEAFIAARRMQGPPPPPPPRQRRSAAACPVQSRGARAPLRDARGAARRNRAARHPERSRGTWGDGRRATLAPRSLDYARDDGGRDRAAAGASKLAQSGGGSELPHSNRILPMQITPELVASHGITEDEYKRIEQILGRAPNYTELGIFSVMWSEHCSYKSSRIHLRNFPTSGPRVIQGPGENAGVIDIGDGWVAAFKMESHNHPSFIEPYQGAATGVGGILRDIFTMGARPIACLDSLRFGELDAPRMKYLVDGVVRGICGYGNCIGIPTIVGETSLHASYSGNILVNVFALGVAKKDKIFKGTASGVGNPVIYVGSKTGRDGIHGATMASAEFDEASEEKRPTVQVGDPFTEKLLLEACLEIMETDAIVGIQDMGAAGLTSSSFEMAGRAGTGVRMYLDRVPVRESGMTPYEIMLSESQERMLIVAKRGREDEVVRTFEKWDLNAAVVGEVTDDGFVRLLWSGEEVAAIPVDPISTEAPVYERPIAAPDRVIPQSLKRQRVDDRDLTDDFFRLIASPTLCSKRWIWKQYD